MLIPLMFLSAAASALPDISVTAGPRGFVAKVTDFDARQQGAVDAEIDRRARQLCKENQVRWGEFRSTASLGKQPGTEPALVKGYTREFACVVPKAAAYEAAPADWKATTADLSDVQRVFQGYYDRRDHGEFSSALKLFAPDVIGEAANWAEEMKAFNKELGPGKRRVTGITWYVNPDSAPHPGVYVAVDFVGDFPSQYFYCGYLVLFRQGAGSYEITREEQNRFAHGDGSADPAQIAQMRAAACRE